VEAERFQKLDPFEVSAVEIPNIKLDEKINRGLFELTYREHFVRVRQLSEFLSVAGKQF
jgi:hypothetical protein